MQTYIYGFLIATILFSYQSLRLGVKTWYISVASILLLSALWIVSLPVILVMSVLKVKTQLRDLIK